MAEAVRTDHPWKNTISFGSARNNLNAWIQTLAMPRLLKSFLAEERSTHLGGDICYA